MRRRKFLSLSATTVGGAVAYSVEEKAFGMFARAKTPPPPLRFFAPAEAAIVVAATERIFPTDESGPGAKEAGVMAYIDRQLAGPYGHDRHRYTAPPFEDGPVEFGYQGKATPRGIYREGLAQLKGFDHLSPAEQDAAFQQIRAWLVF